MARKRGGLAGLWDRNKGAIKAIAPAALSFIPGIGVPLAAAAGAAMGGLDRPGRSGIGLDVGGAIKGGLTGYGIGKGTQALAGGVKGLLTAGGGAGRTAAAGAGTGAMPTGAIDAVTRSGAGFTGMTSTPLAAGGGGAGGGFLSGLGSVARTARENKDLIAMAGKGIGSMLPDAATEAALMNAETNRMRLEEEQRQVRQEEERRRMIAELLMPMARQNFPSYFSNP